jgi:hypothetical protein
VIIDPPQLVDLSGSFTGPSGAVVSGAMAGSTVTFAVVDSAGNAATPPPGAAYRFDSCTIGTTICFTAASASGSQDGQDIPTLSTPGIYGDTLGSDAGGTAGANGSGDGAGDSDGSGLNNPTPDKTAGHGAASLLSVAPPDGDQVLVDPVVTGAGSEELWRKPPADKPKGNPDRANAGPGAKP